MCKEKFWDSSIGRAAENESPVAIIGAFGLASAAGYFKPNPQVEGSNPSPRTKKLIAGLA